MVYYNIFDILTDDSLLTEEDFDNLEKKLDIANDIINSKETIFKEKEQTVEILEYINLIFFDNISKNENYIECMKIVEDTKDRLKKNSNYDMTIDNFNMTIWEEINGKHYRG